MVVSVKQLEKRYGPNRALAGVSLDVEPGTLFGLLGQNGAGKTTLVKILLGLVAKTAGEATLLGRPAGTFSARREVGYLPEDHRLPEYHTSESLLDLYGALQGIPRRERRLRAATLLDLLGLGGRGSLRIRGYSKGMKQRLGLAQALLHAPRVLFLDEPTDGVDPVGRKEIRDLLLEERRRGVTVFVNSHLLGEVEQLCDRVAILRKGEVMVTGTVADLTRRKASWIVGFDRPPAGDLAPPGAALEPHGDAGLLRLSVADESGADAALDRFLAAAAAAGSRIRHLERERGSLEDLYLEIAGAGGHA
jgi:ABC-2 type transport system ATP-binding protein